MVKQESKYPKPRPEGVAVAAAGPRTRMIKIRKRVALRLLSWAVTVIKPVAPYPVTPRELEWSHSYDEY